MGVNQERRALVQQLRQIAQRYDIARVSDTAGRDAVVGMVGELLESPSMSAQDRAAILKAKRAYEATWSSCSGEIGRGPTAVAPATLSGVCGCDDM